MVQGKGIVWPDLLGGLGTSGAPLPAWYSEGPLTCCVTFRVGRKVYIKKNS